MSEAGTGERGAGSEPRILVVDNGGQWTHRIWRRLQDLGCESRIIANTTPLEQIHADGLVLSGGAPRIVWEAPKLGLVGDYFDSFGGPILAICVAHQLMAIHYGGKAGPAEVPEYGQVELEVLEEDELFRGLPRRFTVWGNHNDEVKEAPGFIILAQSGACAIEAMKHRQKPLYGIQFHAEVNDTQYADEIYANFVRVCGGKPVLSEPAADQ